MKKTTLALAILAFASSGLQAATVNFSNLTDLGDGAYGIRTAGGSLLTSANEANYQGVLGFFSITDSAIQSAFTAGNSATIAAGFTQFGLGFEGNSLADGVFEAAVSGSTKEADNNYATQQLYSVFYKGASLATATELLIARLNTTIGLDDPSGFPIAEPVVSLRPSSSTLLVGATGAPNDYGFGSGPLASYQLAAVPVSGVPEPSRGLLLLAGLAGLVMRRRRA